MRSFCAAVVYDVKRAYFAALMTRDVAAIARETVEEGIVKLHAEKRELAEAPRAALWREMCEIQIESGRLARAEEVHIVCCGKEEMPGPKMKHAQNYLLHWGIESRLHTGRGRDTAAEILEAYRATRCDLMVMGAYSRSHLRERILGGVTHYMLTAADIPVFALHV